VFSNIPNDVDKGTFNHQLVLLKKYCAIIESSKTLASQSFRFCFFFLMCVFFNFSSDLFKNLTLNNKK